MQWKFSAENIVKSLRLSESEIGISVGGIDEVTFYWTTIIVGYHWDIKKHFKVYLNKIKIFIHAIIPIA